MQDWANKNDHKKFRSLEKKKHHHKVSKGWMDALGMYLTFQELK